MKKAILLIFLGMSIGIMEPDTLNAQCPMCRIAAESNMKNGGAHGKGLNAGILFMLAMPYLIVGGVGLVWYKNRNKTLDVSKTQVGE